MKYAVLERLFSRAIFALVIVVFFSCEKDLLPEEQETLSLSSVQGQDRKMIKDQYIVIISKESAARNSRAEEVLGSLSKEIEKGGRGKVKYKFRNALTGFSARLSQEQVLQLKKNPEVLHVEQDTYMQLDVETMVQDYPVWGLDRIDQREVLLDRAYSYTATGNGVNVYVMDTGIRYSHDEFQSRAVLGHDFVLDENPTNTDPDQDPGEDCRGHGTHVAGTIGGRTYGVAKEANLISVRVFGCSGSVERSRVVAAIDWITGDAVDNNRLPAVVNMSLGGPFESEFLGIQTAIETSISVGINYVVSAGNDSVDACSKEPAYIPGVLTVGASDLENKMANFSNYGSCVDIFAPGVLIVSASYLDDISTLTYSGTSMSAPHVTGIVALYLEDHPDATPQEVHQAVIENATKNIVLTSEANTTTSLANSNFGPVDFVAPAPPALNLSGEGVKEKGEHVVYLSWQPTDDRFVGLYRNEKIIAVDVPNTGSYTDRTGQKGNNATYLYKLCETTYSNCSEATVLFGDGGTAIVNSPPNCSFSFSIDGLSMSFYDDSNDTDGSITGWLWDFGDGSSSSEQNPVHTYPAPGNYVINLKVTDDKGAQSSSSSTVSLSDPNVTEPEAPTGDFNLTVNSEKVQGKMIFTLTWNPSSSQNVDVFRDGIKVTTVENNGLYKDQTNIRGSGTMTFKLCDSGSTTNCSGEVKVSY